MSLLDKLSQSVSQVADFFSRSNVSSNSNSEVNKTEKTSFWISIFAGKNTATPNFNNAGLNFTAQNINLSNAEIQAKNTGEATRINPAQSTGQVTVRQIPERYAGGSLSVAIKADDTQRSFVTRAFHDHAIKAGLDEEQANDFAERWTSNVTTFSHRGGGVSKPYNDVEFDLLKAKKTAPFDLNKQYDGAILADLNRRVDENTLVVNSVAEEAPQTPSNVTMDVARVKNPDDALREYVQDTYNPIPEGGSRRVWGDKINELLAEAKQTGVAVDNFQIVTDESGKQLAKFTVSGANKQKLDRLFEDALGITIKGEQGSADGQDQGTKMFLDIPITLVNSVTKAGEGLLNIPSTLEDLNHAARTPEGVRTMAMISGAPPMIADALSKAVPEPAPLTPDNRITPQVDLSPLLIPNQSDLFNKDITGKVNPDGNTLGKTAATVTGFAIPFAFGKIIPSANPNEFTLIAPLRTAAGETRAAKIGLVNVQTELDPLVARQFGKIIADNPTATKAYSQMQKFGTEVKLDFGTPPDRLTYGEFFKYKNQMKIYMPNNVDARTAVSTMVHETTHGRSLQLGRQFGSQMDEFRAFTREFLVINGRKPTLQERQQIWQQVQRDYWDKPLERNPFGGRKQ